MKHVGVVIMFLVNVFLEEMLRYLSKKSEGHFNRIAPSMAEVYLALYDGGGGLVLELHYCASGIFLPKKEFCTRCRKQVMIGDLNTLEHIEL